MRGPEASILGGHPGAGAGSTLLTWRGLQLDPRVLLGYPSACLWGAVGEQMDI